MYRRSHVELVVEVVQYPCHTRGTNITLHAIASKSFKPCLLLINQVNINKAVHPEHTNIATLWGPPFNLNINQLTINTYCIHSFLDLAKIYTHFIISFGSFVKPFALVVKKGNQSLKLISDGPWLIFKVILA